MRGLGDKVVVVAGGGSGIGAATARRLGAEGAAVVVGDLVGANADAVAVEVRDAGGRALAVPFDIADDHCRALGAEPAGGRGTDARTTARHHHDLVGQTPHACSPSSGPRTGSTVVPSGIL